MIKECKNSYWLGNEDGSPIIKCHIKKGKPQMFLVMKEAYEGLHRGHSMSYNDNCEFVYHKDGKKDCPFYEP